MLRKGYALLTSPENLKFVVRYYLVQPLGWPNPSQEVLRDVSKLPLAGASVTLVSS